jgi:hypothetical protein
MFIHEYFDPKNLEHLEAYDQLERTGSWPVDFLPQHLTHCPDWKIYITDKIVNAYLEEKLG